MKSLYLTPVLFVLTFLLAVQFDGLTLANSEMQESQITTDNGASDLERGPMQKIAPGAMQILNLNFDFDTKVIFVDQRSWGEIQVPQGEQITLDTIMKLFRKVRKSAGITSSKISQLSGVKKMKAAGADLSFQITYSGDRFELRIDELTGPRRTLEVRCAEGTQIRLAGKNTNYLVQKVFRLNFVMFDMD